MGWYREGEPHN